MIQLTDLGTVAGVAGVKLAQQPVIDVYRDGFKVTVPPSAKTSSLFKGVNHASNG